MPNTPINGLPVPDDQSPNSPPIHFDALADQLDTRLVGRFANVAARDAAITAPVEGMVCHVAAQVSPALPPRLMVYSESRWRLVGPSPLRAINANWNATDYPNIPFTESPRFLIALTIPDPGFPYRMQAIAQGELGNQNATLTTTRWDLRLRVTGSSSFIWDIAHPVGVPLSGGGTAFPIAFQRINTGITDESFTGPATVTVEAVRAFGGANSGVGELTVLNRRLSVWRHAG